jgi:xylulose-5-phosphate/fructose-6-phosphate phosphoketolase
LPPPAVAALFKPQDRRKGAAKLHLNGWKISNPTILARIPEEQLKKYFEGMGWKPYFVTVREADDTASVPYEAAHQDMMKTLDACLRDFKRGLYPMIVFRSPKAGQGPRRPRAASGHIRFP